MKLTLATFALSALANQPAPAFSEPFKKPRNTAEEIANVIAWRDWDNAQKGDNK